MTLTTRRGTAAALGAVCAALLLTPALHAQGAAQKLKEAEEKRAAVIAKVTPSVVAVLNAQGNNGGSGVIIDEEGYALTNFHVVAGTGPVMKCGLSDGVLYDGVLVGLDKVGDVALIKLLPKKPGAKFPFSKMGDSDKVKPGDWSYAMGNPFLLATDFTPTVTFGLISGTHRYQYPSGTLLEYTDCIQIDTSINPGNSGGPLYNTDGEVIGINGRGSFEKRSRINSGVGYAISINQIKNFMGHLRAGLDSDHATLGAGVESESEDGSINKMIIRGLLADCDAARRGLEPGDHLVNFAGRPMNSVNEYKNVLGLFPKGWRVPMSYRRENKKTEMLVRLMGVQKQEVNDQGQPQPPQPQPQPGRPPVRPPASGPAAKLYEAKAGFANYYFNRQERDRLVKAFLKHGDFSDAKGAWSIKATGKAQDENTEMFWNFKEDKPGNPVVTMTIRSLDYRLEPLKSDLSPAELKAPARSGGFITALYHLRQLLANPSDKGFEGEFIHGGHEPIYPPRTDGGKTDYVKDRVMCEVLRTRHAGTGVKWYFSMADQKLLAFEVTVDREEDPCEVYCFDYKEVEKGKSLPHRFIVVHSGDGGERNTYADLKVDSYKPSK